MKIRLSRRILALAVAFVMVLGLVPTAAFARTAGKDGSAEMNEAYAAKETLMPVGPSFSTYTLLEWTPESDPDAIYSRASIPLAEREGGFVVNPMANPEAKLMLCSLANSDHDNTSTQGTESFLSYAFNYWQYVDSFVYWSGSEEGLIVCPTGEFIDAAHTNGVPVVATLGFPWGSGNGYVEEVDAFCQKAADGSFPVADKLIEVMDYYGFDGYFFNQESYGCTADMSKRLKEMIHYMHAKRPDMLISWYDSMTEYGHVSYVNGINSSNKLWMEDDANGVRGVDEFFMNYNWGSSTISTTISTMKSIGRSQFDAFAGIDVQQNCMDTWFSDHLLVDEDGLAKLSLALYCPNSTLGLSADGAQFHEVERTFYTNAVEDPRDTSVDVADSSVSDWAGMSRLFADKTPITSAPFVTDFNSGHGLGYYVDGVLSRDAEWSYQSNQDVMPTYTWIIDSNGTQKLEGDYDFTDAYNGGSSIKFSGTIDASNMIKLFSTNVEITDGMTVNMTAKGGLEDAYLVLYVGDADAESYMDCDRISCMFEDTEGWATAEALLGFYEGKILYGIGLDVDGAQADYEINIGRVSIIDKDRAALNGPASITLDEILYLDAYTAEARIFWSKVTGASSYEIYKRNADGSRSLIMETPSTAFYIPTLKRAADEENVTLEIVPINRNGQRGTGTQMVIDWAYANGDTDEVLDLVFENVCLNAKVTGVSFANSGEPASKALDGTAANNSKWCATNQGSGWMSIDVGREVTVRRWRVEHAEYGGESNDMNTIDFALEYKDKASNTWKEVKRIRNNHDAVTDVLLDTPVTAQEWRLYVYDDGSSPWGGIRIYEWQMFETAQFPQTAVVPMHFASAFNGVGADDTFTLDKVPAGQTVKVYDAGGNILGEAVADGSIVTLTGLNFGTADAGRVYYTTTSNAAAESAKLSAPFEAENADKSAPAESVEFVKYSRPGSVSSSSGDDIYTTMTVKGLGVGDVVYVLGDESKASLPADGDSVSIDGVRVARAGGQIQLQVKRVGQIISDPYAVATPAFPEPTATIQVYAENAAGETLTGVRFEVVDARGEVVSQLSTTSDSGARATVALGTYTVRNTESPEGYGLAADLTVIPRIEGWTTAYTVTIPVYTEPEPTDPEPTDPEPTDPPALEPDDDSRDIPVEVLIPTAGDYERNGGASEGPPELVLDGNPNTMWHTDWKGTSRANHWIQFELTGDYEVDGLRYQPRQGGGANGIITRYDVQVSDDGIEFRSVATGNWAADASWKLAQFDAEHVKYVRLVSLDATSEISYVFASAAEIRLTGEVYAAPPAVDPTVNQALNAEIVAYNGTKLNDPSVGPEKLFDGAMSNQNTDKWCENGKNLWVAFDVGAEMTFGQLKLYHAGANNEWTPAPGAINTEAYEFYVLNESLIPAEDLLGMDYELRSSVLSSDSYWTLVASRTGNTEDITVDELDVTGRIFKINISDTDSTGWGDCVRLYELEMYAKDGTVDPEPTDPEPTDPEPTDPEEEALQKILHLDNGRKLYSKDWIIALLNEMSAAGYTHLQLAFGNDGLRFVLDDMSVTVGSTTYASDDVKAGIELGNRNYDSSHQGDEQCGTIDADSQTALTESEMDEILAHAADVGIEIVPHLNMPGHMDALIDAIEYVGIENAHFTGKSYWGTPYEPSVRSLNIENDTAIAFTQEILKKYAAYFSANGCGYFHIGADEFGNDAYNGSMGFPSMGAALYTKFAEFVNDAAAIVKDYGMTPRAWNDGIRYTSYSDDFDTDIEITYWSSGWWGYNLASASSLHDAGHGMINTHGDYYFILGANDTFTEGSSAEHTPGVYEPAASYDITSFMGGSTITDPVGGMFCIWGDHPYAETETEVAANIRLALRAMALRMDGKSLDGMDTSVVEGGFREDGTIEGTEAVEPVDKSDLLFYMEYAEVYEQSELTPESWAALSEALDNARAVYADPNATQEEVDLAAELLVDAILNVEYLPSYYVMIAAMENGTVTADVDEAREGQLVTLTVTPDEGYALVNGSLKANDVPIEGNSFRMPAEDVIITAEFFNVYDDALAAAQEAQAAAEAAEAAAEEAQRKAEEAQAAAEEAAAAAGEDREAAEAAQREAEEAQAAAEAAQKAAEDAQTAAEAAAAAAEAHDIAAAQAAAEAAKHAQEVAQLYQEIAAMKAEMAEYLKDAQKAAEEAEEHRKAAEAAELACAKYYALLRLAQYADDDDFDAIGKAKLEAVVAEAIEAINAAESIAAVEEALAEAMAAIDLISLVLPFTDVPEDAFYTDAVKWAVSKGITNGTSETTFSPNKILTRAETVTFLWRAAGSPKPALTQNPFVDVKETDYYYEAVLWAAETGVTTGIDANYFDPFGAANRAQVVTFLWRAHGEPAVQGTNRFTDVPAGEWFHDAVLWAQERGITTGMSETYFGALVQCNRAQMVTFLYRTYA